MKQQAKNVSRWKLAALSVLCLSLFIVLACSEEKLVDANAVEAYPEFEGGSEAFYNYLREEIIYPLQARQAGVEGRVDVQFVVDKDGSISEAEAITHQIGRGITACEGHGRSHLLPFVDIRAGCDEEAVRVVKSAPRFKPATQNGKPVRVRMVVPVFFELMPDENNPDKTTGGIVSIGKIQSQNKLKVDARYADGEWIGTVYDEQLNKLPGANIVVPGTTTRTTSAADGTFKLKSEEGYGTLVTFVGHGPVVIVTSLLGPGKNWQEIIDHPRFGSPDRKFPLKNPVTPEKKI